MNHRQLVINKMNEGQEPDVKPYVWTTIPRSLRLFWLEYFRNKKQNSIT